MDLTAESTDCPSYTINPDRRDEKIKPITEPPERFWEQKSKSHHDVLNWYSKNLDELTAGWTLDGAPMDAPKLLDAKFSFPAILS